MLNLLGNLLKMVLRATCSLQSCAPLLSFLSDPPPVCAGWLISTLCASVCVYVCVLVLGDSASPLRSTESEAAGAADADRLFSRQGQLGDREGETEWETIEEKPRELKQTQDQTTKRHRTNEFILPTLALVQALRATGNGTWTAQWHRAFRGVRK